MKENDIDVDGIEVINMIGESVDEQPKKTDKEFQDTIMFYQDKITYLEGLVKKYKFDVVTGLMGKQDFNDKFNRVFEEHLFADEGFTLVIADIDGLHNVNRTKGYSAGDKYIETVAIALKEQFAFQHIFRISGDEFCIIARHNILSIEVIEEKMQNIPHVTYAISDSIGFSNPKQMFEVTDTILTKLKATKKQSRL